MVYFKINTSYGIITIGGVFMASKGQKFNKYTDEFKKDIALQHINEGKSYGYLSNT